MVNLLSRPHKHTLFVCRSGGDWGGRADSAAAEPAEPGCGQNLFRQGAACAEGKTDSLIMHHALIIDINHLMCSLKSNLCNISAHSPRNVNRTFLWNLLYKITFFSASDLACSFSIFQISRVFQLRQDGRLEQTVSMATDNQPLMQHLHITYRRSSWPNGLAGFFYTEMRQSGKINAAKKGSINNHSWVR